MSYCVDPSNDMKLLQTPRQVNSGASIACWSVAGDLEPGDADKKQENPVFKMMQSGGWFSNPVIKNKEGWDPTFALLIGFLCSKEYNPKEIKEDLNPIFPNSPPGRSIF